MKVSRGRLVIHAAVLILVLGAASAAFAQDSNLDTTSRPTVGPAAPATNGISVPTPEGTGFAYSGTWIAASKFTMRLNSSAPMLSYQTMHFYNSVGSASPTRYFAQIDLEPGVLLNLYTCVFDDSSAVNNLSHSIQKYSIDFTTTPPARTGVLLANGASTGATGVQYQNVVVSPTETFLPLPDGFHVNQYYLAVDVASDTSLAGCFVFWNRQVSPAPLTASFTDVPPSHPYFQFIEALKASGITGGCGTGVNYCPGDPVTRGQMAVFLARGLGLYWPY
jgi:hypothetical protein